MLVYFLNLDNHNHMNFDEHFLQSNTCSVIFHFRLQILKYFYKMNVNFLFPLGCILTLGVHVLAGLGGSAVLQES